MKGFMKPKADKQIKAPQAPKTQTGTITKRIMIASVGSVRMLDGGCVVVVDGKQEVIKGRKASIIIED